MMFRKFRTLRASRYAVASSPPSPKPLVSRRFRFLNAGNRLWFKPSGNSRSQLSPDTTSWSVDPAEQAVYGVPLAYRNVANRPTFSKMDPAVDPWFQSFGNVSDAAAARVCGRLKSVGSTACGGGWLPPETAFSTRDPKSIY